MAFAFNLTAVLLTVLVPPAAIGILGGALARWWRPAARAAVLLIALFGFWAASVFLLPWGRLPEASHFRYPILAGIVGGVVIGIALSLRLSRFWLSRPAS